jgi:hypothetical protein
MGSRKRRARRQVDPEKAAASQNAKKDYEAQISELSDKFEDVDPDRICEAMHPFEVTGLCGDKPLSIAQKAITFCIEHQGGAASDTEILAFLRRFWGEIIPKEDRKHSSVPDKRILHINFSIQKGKRFLFVRSPDDPEKWCLNSPQGPIENNRKIGEQVQQFQDKMMGIMKKQGTEGATFDELMGLCHEIEDVDGHFQGLPLKARLKAFLTSKKVIHEVSYDERTQKWAIATKTKVERKFKPDHFLPAALKGRHLREISINELWTILKDRGVY